MTRYSSNDTPPTDAELDQFYGEEWLPAPHDAVCNAIRAIHYVDFDAETAQTIIAVLADKMRNCQFTQDKKEAIEHLEDAFQALD